MTKLVALPVGEVLRLDSLKPEGNAIDTEGVRAKPNQSGKVAIPGRAGCTLWMRRQSIRGTR